jgi:hypothetical protein
MGCAILAARAPTGKESNISFTGGEPWAIRADNKSMQ